MATRTDLESRIADDLIRNDLTSQITAAVDTAIRAYRSERLTFNEAYRVTATLTVSAYLTPLTALSVRFRKIDRLRIVRTSNDLWDLYKRDYDWIMSRQDVNATTQPIEYCVYNDTIHYDSNADQTYTLYIDGVKDLGEGATLSYSVNSTAAWFNDGRELIRHRARRELYSHVLKDFELAAAAKGAEDEAKRILKSDHGEQNGTGAIRPTEF